MASVQEHYESVLAGVYSWMYGGFESAVEKYSDFFASHNITPCSTAIAVDLGAGTGFQSVPLALAGFHVTSIDICGKLLSELDNNAAGHSIRTIEDDLLNFPHHLKDKAEIIVCMTDTILHLGSRNEVEDLFIHIIDNLAENGRFIVSFRDLSFELKGPSRFIPVKSDENYILTCFLEYEPEVVNVYDVLYFRDDGQWSMKKSCYKKLRLSVDWIVNELARAGLKIVSSENANGFVSIIASK